MPMELVSTPTLGWDIFDAMGGSLAALPLRICEIVAQLSDARRQSAYTRITGAFSPLLAEQFAQAAAGHHRLRT